MKKELKKHGMLLLAIVFLFFTQFLFFRDEIEFSKEEQFFAIGELGIFFVFFGLSLLCVPSGILTGWSFLGSIGLAVLRGFLFDFEPEVLFVVLLHVPVFIFFLSQENHTKHAKNPWTTVLSIYPVLLLTVFLYSAVKNPDYVKRLITVGVDYGCFLFPALILLCGSVLLVPKGKKAIKKKTRSRLREDYLSAMVILAETFLLLRFYDAPKVNYTVSLFWAVSLVVLYAKENPLLRAYRNMILEKQDAFFGIASKAARTEKQ